MNLIRLQNCQSCKHSEPISDNADLECRRYPPSATAVLVPMGPGRAGIEVHAALPHVHPDMWCGEFAPRLLGGPTFQSQGGVNAVD